MVISRFDSASQLRPSNQPNRGQFLTDHFTPRSGGTIPYNEDDSKKDRKDDRKPSSDGGGGPGGGDEGNGNGNGGGNRDSSPPQSPNKGPKKDKRKTKRGVMGMEMMGMILIRILKTVRKSLSDG